MPQVVPFLSGFFGASVGAGTAAFAAGAAASSFLTTNIAGRLLATVAVSALARAVAPKPKVRVGGIRAQRTMTGGTTPAAFILGRYATEGQLVAPPMSQGSAGGTPNAYLTYVIELGDIPGQTLESVIIDGEPVTLGATPHPDYGLPVEGRFQDHAWVKYYDGTQVAADPMLVDKFGADPDRPWDAAMVGTGICYAICTFRLKRDLWSGFPRVRFVMGGVPLYDPRRDDTVGGTGPHRWADSSTWEPSDNAAVQVYNILRGIALPSGDIWGGGIPAEDLPLSNWFAAMNAADAGVTLADGSTEPAWRAGYEVFVADEPASVIEELLRGCSGHTAEVGGVFKISIGGPGLPVFFFTDDDVNIRESRQFDPFPGIGDIYNGVHASHPDPDALWQSTDAPPRYDAAREAEDGGRRLVADLRLPAVPWPRQVQRVMRAYLEEERRFRRHELTLAPEAIPLEPLDAVSWTSARNGYASKVFEVAAITDPLVLSRPRLALRERDPADYDWQPAYERPVTVPAVTVAQPAPYAIADAAWSVAAATVEDASGADRRPALRIAWDPAGLDDIAGLAWEARVQATGAAVAAGSVPDIAAGSATLSEGILPATAYELRLRPVPVGGRAAAWSGWKAVTAPDIRLAPGDLDDRLTTTGTPSGLALSTELVADGRARVSATWTAGADAVAHEVGVARGGGNEVIVAAGEAAFRSDALPAEVFTIRVRGVSATGTKSAWTAAQSITAATDTTPPAVPGTPALTPGFDTIWVEFAGVSDADLKHYEICYKNSSTVPRANPTSPIVTTISVEAVISGLGDGATKWVFVRAVDTSGNKSAWSAGASATTSDPALTGVTAADIQGIVDATSFAAGLSAVGVVSTLPADNSEYDTVLLTTDSKLYRWDGAAWSKDVDGADLVTDSVTTGALAAGAVKAEQIGAGAVTASKMGVGDFTNLVTDPEYMDASYWTGAAHTIDAAFVPAAYGSPNRLTITGDGSTTKYVNTPWIPIDNAGEEFWFSARGRTQGAVGTARVSVQYATDETYATTATTTAVDFTTGSTVTKTSAVSIPAGYRYARIRLVKRNDGCVDARFGRVEWRRRNKGELIVDGALQANHVGTNEIIANSANIKDAVITDVKIKDLSANKLKVVPGEDGLPIGITVGSTGTTIGSVETWANDPANRINTGPGTRIQAGKITIWGSNTLDDLPDWRYGADVTKIDGGHIYAQTIDVVSLAVGLGGDNLIGNSDFSQGTLGWGDAGSATIGGFTWSSGLLQSGSYSATGYPVWALQLSGVSATSDGWRRVFYAPPNPDGSLAVGVPVTPGNAYEVSAQLSIHECYVKLRIAWYDATGASIQTDTVLTETGAVKGSSNNPAAWTRYSGQAAAPANAAYARPYFQIHETVPGTGSTAALYIHAPQFCETTLGAAQVLYAIGGKTVIDGASIKTGSLTADRVDTVDFEAKGLALFGTGLESTNYAEDGSGNPTAGVKLDAATGTIKALKVISTEALNDNAVTEVYSSYGAGDQYIAPGPFQNDCIVTMFATALVKVTNTGGAGSKSGRLEVARGWSALLASPDVVAADNSPATTVEQEYMSLVYRDTRSAGATPNYRARFAGSADTSQNISLLLLVTYK